MRQDIEISAICHLLSDVIRLVYETYLCGKYNKMYKFDNLLVTRLVFLGLNKHEDLLTFQRELYNYFHQFCTSYTL